MDSGACRTFPLQIWSEPSAAILPLAWHGFHMPLPELWTVVLSREGFPLCLEHCKQAGPDGEGEVPGLTVPYSFSALGSWKGS